MSVPAATASAPARLEPTGSAGVPGRRRALALVALATVGGLSVWFSTNAVAPALGEELGFAGNEVAWLTIAVQLGFVAGSLASALGNLSERMHPRRLFAIAALLAAVANAAPVALDGYAWWLAARFATGCLLGGVYPPAMHVVAGWYREGRGLALGVVVGALTLGSGSPHLLRAALAGAWPATMIGASVLALLAATVMWWLVRDGPFHAPPARVRASEFWSGLASRGNLLALGGYLGHMWELYAMWAWLPIYLVLIYGGRELTGTGLSAGSLAAFAVFALGAISCVVAGSLAERYGRTAVTAGAMVVSGSSALLIGFVPGGLVVVTLVAAVWGASVVADSAQFSAAITELSDERYRGSVLALQLGTGFLLTAVTIRAVPALESAAGWGPAFALLAIGPLVGTACMLALRRLPEAARLAGGRR